MPVTCGHKDSKGSYCIWGSHGGHYYYTPGDSESMKRAHAKAESQGRAARANGYTGALPNRSGNTNPNEEEPGEEIDPGDEDDYELYNNLSDAFDHLYRSIEELRKNLLR